MKRYHFPLRPLGVLRAHRELRAREAFATAVHAYTAAEENLAGVRERKGRLEAILADNRRGTFDAAEAAAFYRDYGRVCAEEISTERAVFAARAEMHARREQYLAASRDLKAITRLEEKSRAAYRREVEHHAQAELDEFAGHRFLQARASLTR
jgi:flagellar FliJ protein